MSSKEEDTSEDVLVRRKKRKRVTTTVTRKRKKIQEEENGSKISWFEESVHDADAQPSKSDPLRFPSSHGFESSPFLTRLVAISFDCKGEYAYGANKNVVFRWSLKESKNLEVFAGEIPQQPEQQDDQQHQPSSVPIFREIVDIEIDEKAGVLYVLDEEDVRLHTVDLRSRAVTRFLDMSSEGKFLRITLSTKRDMLYLVDNKQNNIFTLKTSTKELKRLAGIPFLPGDVDGDVELARFNSPTDIVVDELRDCLYIADSVNDKVRKIVLNSEDRSKGVQVQTLCGSFEEGDCDGDAEKARFNGPWALALHEEKGLIYVGDRFNQKIKCIDCVTGCVETVYDFRVTKHKRGGEYYHPWSLTLTPDAREIYVMALDSRAPKTLNQDAGFFGVERVILPKPARYGMICFLLYSFSCELHKKLFTYHTGPLVIPKSTLQEDLQRTIGDSSLPQGLVTFVVGPSSQRFEHISKCLLCVRSEYFSHMFRSGMRETSASEIRIEDVKPKAFGWLLKYLISDVIEWNSGSTEDMIDVFHLARYFGVNRLEMMTRRDIEDNLTLKNAVSVRTSSNHSLQPHSITHSNILGTTNCYAF